MNRMNKLRPISNPVETPSEAEVLKAVKVLNDARLAVYQALYEYGFTNPEGNPFLVRYHIISGHLTCWIEVVYNGPRGEEYAFSVKDPRNGLVNTMMLDEAIKEGKKPISYRACCPLAEHRGCVCLESFDCVIHGQSCFGTHD